MRSGRIVEDNLKDLRAEEVGETFGSCQRLMLGTRERRWGRLIIAGIFPTDLVAIGESIVLVGMPIAPNNEGPLPVHVALKGVVWRRPAGERAHGGRRVEQNGALIWGQEKIRN